MLPVANPIDGQYINYCNRSTQTIPLSLNYFDYTKNQLRLSKNNQEMMTYIKDCCKPQHLYFISDEEIKADDTVYHIISKTVFNVRDKMYDGLLNSLNNSLNNSTYYYKIITTTDTNLSYIKHDESVPYPKGSQITLPRPSYDFLKAYCEQGGIDNVLIEMSVPFKANVLNSYVSRDEIIEALKLKVAPDNTITIKELKVKDSCSRDEVVALFKKYDDYLCNTLPDINQSPEDWIKNILK